MLMILQSGFALLRSGRLLTKVYFRRVRLFVITKSVKKTRQYLRCQWKRIQSLDSIDADIHNRTIMRLLHEKSGRRVGDGC